MDPELRAYLEAMEGRLATKADMTGLRTEIGALRGETAELRTEMTALRGETAEQFVAVRGETAELRTEMTALRGETAEQFVAVRGETAELRTGMTELRGQTAELRTGMTELRTGMTELRAEVAEQFLGLHVAVRTVREHVNRAEKRLDKSIKAWKLESSLALREIERLHRSMGRLTRRVRRVELRRA